MKLTPSCLEGTCGGCRNCAEDDQNNIDAELEDQAAREIDADLDDWVAGPFGAAVHISEALPCA
jgi:hypothetical protein